MPERRVEVLAWIARAFNATEDVVYTGLGVLLAGGALTLLVQSVIGFGRGVASGNVRTIELLDQILLVVLIVELLYTVQVSLLKHALVPEPFLIVGLISAIRRVLVLTAEFDELHRTMATIAHQLLIELAVLTVLILALVASLALLRRKKAPIEAGDAA